MHRQLVASTSDTNEVDFAVLPGQSAENLAEHVGDMLLDIPVISDEVPVLDGGAVVDHGGQRHAAPHLKRDGFLSGVPPEMLSSVGKDNAWWVRVESRTLLLLQGLNDRDHCAFVDATSVVGDTEGKVAQLLARLAENDDDSRLLREVLTDEDGHIGLVGARAKW